MASRSSLRQASQLIRNHRLSLQPPRARNYSSQTILTPSTCARTPASSRLLFSHITQQSRNLSLWGPGSASTKAAGPEIEPAPTSISPPSSSSNINTIEPQGFESIRAIRANDTSSDFSPLDSHKPNSLEPQFIEDIQQTIAQPHGGIAPTTPLEEIPERIGYLYEVCGIDFGWGPSSIMQWVLEHLHIWGGLSWTASIVAMAILIRGSILPLMIGAAKESAKMKDMGVAMKPLRDENTVAKEKGDMQAQQRIQLQMRALATEYKVNFPKLLAPMLLQIPFGFGAWRNLRNCAEVPVPGFVTESWLWNIDLTFADELYIVPLTSSLLIWLSIHINTRANKASGTGIANEDAMKLLSYAFPVVSFIFVSFQPGAVQLYFLASTAVGAFNAWLMTVTSFRSYFQMPPLNPATKTPGPPSKSRSGTKGGQTLLRRRKVIDVKARTVSKQDNTAAEAAATQNISGIDKTVDGVKKTFKGAFGSWFEGGKDKAEKMAKKNAAVSRAKRQAEEASERRQRNRMAGGQVETDTQRR